MYAQKFRAAWQGGRTCAARPYARTDQYVCTKFPFGVARGTGNITKVRSARVARLTLCFLFFSFFIINSNTQAQWKLLKASPGNFEVIYFLDLPGPSRIGFLGGFDSLFKTTDGGSTWKPIIFDDPNAGYGGVTRYNDITFKDSITGWVATDFGGFKTTDGGETWFLVTINDSGSGGTVWGIYYDKVSDGLFLSTFAGAAPVWHGFNELSWDEGVTWKPFASVGNENSGGFAFADGNNGLLSWGDYWPAPWWRTTDGGHSWNALSFDTACWQPLAIARTKTYFAVSSPGNVFRTDNAGDTWSLIYSFPPQIRMPDGPDSGQTGSCIRGNLDSLYVMACSGCYLSTDQGLSWKYLCGVPDLRIPTQRFYLRDKLLYVIGFDSTRYAQLWMLNIDSLNTVTSSSSVQLGNGLKQETIYSGDTVRVYYLSDSGLGSEIGSDSISISISFDTNSLSLVRFVPDSGWSIKDSSYSNGTYHLLLVDSDSLGLDSSAVILRADFASYLSSTPQSKVYLDSVHFYGHRLNCDCAVASVTGADSVEIDFEGCADSLLLAAMSGKPLFTIESIQPNPAQDEITVHLSGNVQPVIEMYDALGRSVLNCNPTTPQPPPSIGGGVILDVSNVPSGIYFVRVSAGGYVQSRSVVVQH